MTIDFNAVLDFAGRLTVVGLLTVSIVVIVVGLMRRWWIPYFLHAEIVADLRGQLVAMTNDRDQWREIGLRQMALTEAAVGGIRHVAARNT